MLRRLVTRRLGPVGVVLSEIGGGRALPGITALMVAAALAEIVGVASVAPFIGIVAGGTTSNPFVRSLLDTFAGLEPVVVLGLVSFVALAISNLLQAATSYAILRFTWSAGEVLSSRIFDSLLARPYADLMRANSSEALTSLLQDVTSAVGNVLIPILGTIARSVAALAVLGLLLVVNWKIALLATAIAAGSYALVFRLLGPAIMKHGKRYYAERRQMYQLATEVFTAIPEVKVFSGERYFAERFTGLAKSAAEADARSQMMRQIPRYAIETVAFGGMIAIVIVLVAVVADPRDIWPLLAIYAVAAWRMLPAAQQIFSNIASIRQHGPALDSLNRSLAETGPAHALPDVAGPPTLVAVSPPERGLGVEMTNVAFAYDDAAAPVLADFSLTVAAGETVGITGRSGAGKSTLLALGLGLLEPQSGTVLLGGRPAREAILARRIAYVPQHPSFLDDSLRRNVAFGVADGRIDDARVRASLAAAGLEALLASLPQGIATTIGERGGNLSGGQRQRVALARALYLDPGLVVLDEFTSALDAATERELLDTLPAMLRGRTTLIVTHRTEVLDVCDRVIEL